MSLLQPPGSPYYPPRARWRTPFSALGCRIRLSLGRWGIRQPTARRIFNVCMQFVVPGLAFYFTGHRRIAKCTFAVWMLAITVFVVWLGTLAANFAFLLMVSAHGASVSQLVAPVTRQIPFSRRLILGAMLFFALAVAIYEPVLRWCFANVALPLRTSTGVIIVNPKADCSRLSQGELAAYRIESTSSPGLTVRGGYGIGAVLALPGDNVKFEPDKLTINGIAKTRLVSMPVSGELVVPEKSWLIWPEFDIPTFGHVSGEAVAQQMLKIAVVDQRRLVGRPYNRWFGRKQITHEQVR